MTWKNIKGLFWQSESDGAAPVGETATGEEMSDEDFAAFLADSEYGVSPDGEPPAGDPIDVSGVTVTIDADSVSIDFQGQYDAASIPNTDEVEQVEAFLSRLDNSLPQASKIAAAEAFLGAVGKSKEDVLTDAERKIRVVRRLVRGKQDEHNMTVEHEQAAIDDLQKQIEERRQKIESSTKELEGFRHACTVEEARLQAARVFFGQISNLAAEGTQQGSGQ